ncbi:CPBP family intramembrane metalloprotease [Micromonospora rifamycinica]|uniref:CPBP family intramembrane glutamic endopeptidase n=1 Tax=Micromonospora rifamycinica TaxID=291594 RepID=UPI002E2B3369|nr:type II CAAX endopeptidase family protein [Micromonospora rifamycinica]
MPVSVLRPPAPAAGVVAGSSAMAYHRMARPWVTAWWRPPLAVAVALVLVVTTMAVAAVVGRSLPSLPVLGGNTALAWSFAGIAAALPLVLLTVRWVERRPAGTVSSVVGRLRWRWLAVCLAAATPIAALSLLVGVVGVAASAAAPPSDAGPSWVGIGPYLGTLAVVGALMIGQVATEEYLSRGVLMQSIGWFFRSPWPGITIQAALFAALHGVGTAAGLAATFTIGVALGWLTVRTGGLEAGIAFHLAYNGTILLVAAAVSDNDPAANLAGAPWQLAAAQAIGALAYTSVTRVLAAVAPAALFPPHPTA